MAPFFVEVRWHRSDGDYRDPVKRWVVNIRSIKDYVSVKYGPVLRSYGQALRATEMHGAGALVMVSH